MQGRKNFLPNAVHQGHLAYAFNDQSQHHSMHIGVVTSCALGLGNNSGKLPEPCLPAELGINPLRRGECHLKAQHLIDSHLRKVGQLRRIVGYRGIQREPVFFP